MGTRDIVFELVMCDGGFTTLSIIMVFLSRYNTYHDTILITIVQQNINSKKKKTTELPLVIPTIPHPNKSNLHITIK